MSVSSPNPLSAARRKARAEAAAWVVKLHGPHRTPALEAAFHAWLSQDAENRRQFERVTEVWDDARGIPLGGVSRPAYWNRVTGTRRWAIAAVTLLVFGGVGVSGYWAWFANMYRTRVGEQRVIRLDDGSRVSLNSDTRLEIKFSRDQRWVSLSRGEAYFEVAHNPNRPFVVSAGRHDVTAVGTTFLVRYDADITAVTLVEGKVIVSNAAAPRSVQEQDRSPLRPIQEKSSQQVTDRQQQPLPDSSGGLAPGIQHPAHRSGHDDGGSAQVLTLTPGERLVLAPNAGPKLDSPHIEAVTAWRRGEVVLDKTPLADAAAEMNRYEDDKLVIGSPEVGKLRISGIYRVGDSAGFAQTIGKLYRLQVKEGDGEIRLSAGLPATDPRP